MAESTEKISEKLKQTQEFCGEVESYLKENFFIEGKTMAAWKKYFKVAIPEEVTFPTLVNLSREIWNKYQQAAFFRDSQQVQLAIMEQAAKDKFHTEWNSIRISTQQQTGKPLAAESCKIAATLAIKDLDSAISNQKVIHTFWVKTCDTLTELRKLLELMGYALSGDARIQRDVVIKGEVQ